MLKAMLIKEFILIMRDKHALAALFIMPSIFILIMSMALKDTFGNDHALLNYTIIDRNQTVQSEQVNTLLRVNTLFQKHDLVIKDQTELQKALNGDVHFVISIPSDFTENLGKKQLDTALLHIDVATDVKPEMVSLVKSALAGIIRQQRLQKIQNDLKIFLPDIAQKLDGFSFEAQDVLDIHYNGMKAEQVPSSTQQSVPSWIVFGMFFIIIPMSTIFINERTQNTLLRMHAMNISIPALFTGKIVPYMVINQIQVWLMIGVGIFIVPLLGAEALTLGNSIAGLVMVSTGLSLAAIGTSILIAVSVNTVEQATTIGGISNILFGAIGGIMVPKFFMPQVMQTLTNISPMSWGLEGFLDIFLRGLGAQAVIKESLALAGFGVGLLMIAWLIFSYRTKRGI